MNTDEPNDEQGPTEPKDARVAPLEAHIQIGTQIVKRCSACGSTEPHHLKYVVEHGLCVT